MYGLEDAPPRRCTSARDNLAQNNNSDDNVEGDDYGANNCSDDGDSGRDGDDGDSDGGDDGDGDAASGKYRTLSEGPLWCARRAASGRRYLFMSASGCLK